MYLLLYPVKMNLISEWTEQIHCISYGDMHGKSYFPEIWDTIVMPFIKKTPDVPLVAHNASFDMNVIRQCCEYYGMPVPQISYFDSLAVARRTWPELENHRLTYLGQHFGIVYNAHDALDDSRTCGKIIALAAEKWGVDDVDGLLQVCGISQLQSVC